MVSVFLFDICKQSDIISTGWLRLPICSTVWFMPRQETSPIYRPLSKHLIYNTNINLYIGAGSSFMYDSTPLFQFFALSVSFIVSYYCSQWVPLHNILPLFSRVISIIVSFIHHHCTVYKQVESIKVNYQSFRSYWMRSSKLKINLAYQTSIKHYLKTLFFIKFSDIFACQIPLFIEIESNR